ncbi:MAG: ArsR/SmtB family transcription factor [Candidatus Dormibacteraceae bacterium]
MPVVEESQMAPRSIQVEPSAASELFWSLRAVAGCADLEGRVGTPPIEPARRRLGARVRELWGDGQPCDFSELIILAQLTGHLFDLSLDGFFADLRQPPGAGADDLPLRSETAEDRRRLLDRLGRLARDAGFRAGYRDVVSAVWELARREWEDEGLGAVQEACAARREMAAGGAPLRDLLEAHPGRHRAKFFSQQEDAAERGELALVLTHLGHHSIFLDLPGVYYTALPIGDKSSLSSLRRTSAALAKRAKVLADPTRFAILGHLAEHPSSITEIARAFALAQPTVSAHFRLLREAGLVVPDKRDGRTAFEVDRGRLEALLGDLRRALLAD